MYRIGRIRETCRNLAEIGPGFDLVKCIISARTACLHLLRARLLRYANQDMREIVFVGRTAGRLQILDKILDFAIGDDDFIVDFALA